MARFSAVSSSAFRFAVDRRASRSSATRARADAFRSLRSARLSRPGDTRTLEWRRWSSCQPVTATAPARSAAAVRRQAWGSRGRRTRWSPRPRVPGPRRSRPDGPSRRPGGAPTRPGTTRPVRVRASPVTQARLRAGPSWKSAIWCSDCAKEARPLRELAENGVDRRWGHRPGGLRGRADGEPPEPRRRGYGGDRTWPSGPPR